MLPNSLNQIFLISIFTLTVISTQAQAAYYEVNCSQTAASDIQVGGRVQVSSQYVPPIREPAQVEIVNQAIKQCQAIVQEQVDALPCSTLQAGSLFSFQTGRFSSSSYSTFAFYNEGYLSSTNYSAYGFVRKNSCPN